jgi:hypothetical protein
VPLTDTTLDSFTFYVDLPPGFDPTGIKNSRCALQQIRRVDFRFGSKADIGLVPVDVRYSPKSGHSAALL